MSNRGCQAVNTSISFWQWNLRTRTLATVASALLVLVIIAAAGALIDPSAYAPQFQQKNLSPSLAHPFGTDWMGRDMFMRTVKGLSTSLWIGLLAATVSSVIAVMMGVAAATMGRRTDSFILWLVDLIQGIPHLILLMLISFVLGKGMLGVWMGVALTHWPMLARVIRAEVLAVRHSQYVLAAGKLGSSRWKTAVRHILPHVVPQYIVGLILLFPHAILHEASITFLGFGLLPREPAVGIILSESMRYLTAGMWWLTVLPGASLLTMVLLFDQIGENLQRLLKPAGAQE
ncbi:ABC transporter permease [Acetonema longum]|uniref:Binding-protein-dependent transporters inner membrane component n=1 Tax=Acetonema longum DSM 6540 TaxID=1009370 RepID=F7NJ35_9FIRM|nr:ABC transporter permease [Acetonema longum]EGO63925.1 binding-protein-dependent transporters inner membrane component [Acetonema longum DSM 6540]